MAEQYSVIFGRMLKAGIGSIAACEGKTTAAVEEELAQQCGRAGPTLRRYKEGYLPPTPRIVELLTFAGVQRGYMGREWARRLLHAARHPAPEALLNQLFPPLREQPPAPLPQTHSNLPPATYSQFVMRDQPFAMVRDGLCRRTAFVVIFGMGGTGKTSLAREVAAHCLHQPNAVPSFDAVVWVSDKDRPGTTTLSVVFNTIAQVLGHAGMLYADPNEQQASIDQILRTRRVLLVLDNYETVTDPALISWISRSLPEPSKAILTTREYSPELRGGWPVELRGMREHEARELASERLHMLGLDHLIEDPARLTPLLLATGGNPKAITMAIGLMKHRRQPPANVLDELANPRNELFADLFLHAWGVLNDEARCVLLAMLLFPGGALVDALATTAGIALHDCERALSYLLDLSLLDTQWPSLDAPPRYSLHPLVLAFVRHQGMHEQFDIHAARQRQIGWFAAQLAAMPSEIIQPSGRAQFIEQEEQNLVGMLEYALRQRDKTLLVALFVHMDDIWTVRLDPHLLYQCGMTLPIEGTPPDETCLRDIRIIDTCAWNLIYQRQISEASQLLERTAPYVKQFPDSPLESYYLFDLGCLCYAQNDFAGALDYWQQRLAVDQARGEHHLALYDQFLIADAHQQLGQYAAAEACLRGLEQEPLVQAMRLYADVAYLQARIALQRNDLAQSEQYLQTGLEHAQRFRYQRSIAQIQRCAADLALRRGDPVAAQHRLSEAMALFERLGMRRELGEVRTDMLRITQDNGLARTPDTPTVAGNT